jgi:organic radical activating enzyme
MNPGSPRNLQPMNRFDAELARHGISLRRGRLQTLQVNVGRKCNQTCRHCHVDAAPWRTEMMPESVARRVGEWIRKHRPATVDITGGAPELSEHFRYLVETARENDCHVIDRNNLTIIETEAFAWLAVSSRENDRLTQKADSVHPLS